MKPAPYHLSLPSSRTSCVVFSSPHSGQDYSEEFLKQSTLEPLVLRSSEDAFVDQLFASAPEHGAPLLRACAPRAYVDLNRAMDEIDPAVIEGVKRNVHSPRVNSGLGVIPRVVANGRAIYRGKMPLAEAEARIARYWRPYHATLQELLDQNLSRFGMAVLVDCHSMPHEAVDGITRDGQPRPDIVLGDRFGAASDRGLVETIEAIFSDAGLRVARNSPFAGAYITQSYGRPSRGQHVVQIEIDRSLYMDEAKVTPNANFNTFRALMAGVTAEIAAIGRAKMPLAAE